MRPQGGDIMLMVVLVLVIVVVLLVIVVGLGVGPEFFATCGTHQQPDSHSVLL